MSSHFDYTTLVIGGSLSKKALVKKVDGQILIIKKEEKVQPVFKTKKDLLEFIEKLLSPNTQVLALNFTYPMIPVFENGKLDGILISGSKEHKFEGLVGKKVGTEVEKYIFQKTQRQIKVFVANDVVCLMLSGLTKFTYNQIAGGVVGTGLNFSLFLDKKRLVNLESANFNKFIPTLQGRVIDKQSLQKGVYLYEKEVSGAYLFGHFNLILKEENIDFPAVTSTEQLNEIGLKDIPTVSRKAKMLFERSAAFIASQIAGILEFKKSDLIFVMEGSLFWKANNYQKNIKKYLEKLCPKFRAEFISIENSSILGASELVCSASINIDDDTVRLK